MTGLKSGSAEATSAPGVNDNARAPTAAANLVKDGPTMFQRPSTDAPPKARRQRHQPSATTPSNEWSLLEITTRIASLRGPRRHPPRMALAEKRATCRR